MHARTTVKVAYAKKKWRRLRLRSLIVLRAGGAGGDLHMPPPTAASRKNGSRGVGESPLARKGNHNAAELAIR
jgi:hypothetical protein